MSRTNRAVRPLTSRLRNSVEALEPRVVLSTSMFGHPAIEPTVVVERARKLPILGTISGSILSQSATKGISGVKVELIDGSGDVSQKTVTNRKGAYHFTIRQDGPYLVREVTPKKDTQVVAFSDTAPTGAYAAGAGANSWNYSSTNTNPANGPVGPSSWATIAPAGDLPFEAPIDITGAPIDLSPYLKVSYNPATPTGEINNGKQIQVQLATDGTDTLNVAGQTYNLAQFHYHDPSENTVNGQHATMEEHFVNTDAAGAETVVAVFLQLGAHNNALDPILNAAPALPTSPKGTFPGPIDFSGLLPTSTMGWFYEGSLTTPPLSQPVHWFVFSTPITLDAAQLAKYEAIAKAGGFLPNNRPTQPLDGRTVDENDFDVNFQGQSVGGLDFTLQTPAKK